MIIFYADDLGYGDVSAYGATEITTLNIDRLAPKQSDKLKEMIAAYEAIRELSKDVNGELELK